MAYPKAYDPEYGQQFQILLRNTKYYKAWEHCEYAEDADEKDHLLSNTQSAYRGQGYEFKVITLPRKYWNMEKVNAFRAARRKMRELKRKATLQ